MKEIFPEYYEPDGDDFRGLWSGCLFAFDANVLLDLYRISEESREDLLSLLENPHYLERLWLPHQAALEFQQNRLDVIFSKQISLERVESAFTGGIETFIAGVRKEGEALNKLNRLQGASPIIDIEKLIAPLDGEVERISIKLAEERTNILGGQGKDTIRQRLDSLFSGKVGQPYTLERIKEVAFEGKTRFEKRIPPGYMDYSKKLAGVTDPDDETNQYNQFGDLVLWKQILDKAKQEKRNIVFVTSDTKEDWFLEVKGRTVGPRFELIREALNETNVRFYSYPLVSFYRYAKTYLEQSVRQETVAEVEAVVQAPVLRDGRKTYRLLSLVDTQVRAFLLPARINYFPEKDTLVVSFSPQHKFHHAQLLNRSERLLASAKKVFGEAITIEIHGPLRHDTPTLLSGDTVQRGIMFASTESEIENDSSDEEGEPFISNDLQDDFWGETDTEETNQKLQFVGGERVVHPKFGQGTIVGISGTGARAEVAVIFKEAGPKRLLLRYANLTRLD